MGVSSVPDWSARLDGSSLIDALPTIELADLNAAASLQTRVDRKYLVRPDLVGSLVSDFAGSASALMVANTRVFDYESVYFDSAEFRLYRAAATGRRRRFKVRTRSQANNDPMLEVKAKDGRGRTVKFRAPHLAAAMTELGPAAGGFVDEVVGTNNTTADLHPVLTTRYERSTLFHADSKSRMTIDQNVRCTATDNATATFRAIVVETKSDGAASPFDRWLWGHGLRPVRLSKFSTALAALTTSLPSNRWHRIVTGDLLVVEPG